MAAEVIEQFGSRLPAAAASSSCPSLSLLGPASSGKVHKVTSAEELAP